MRNNRPVVAVTGASAGVGRAVALAFAREGWAVALIARGRERLESAASEVEASGGRSMILLADVADAGALDRAADEIEGSLGPIDVWINNAMATVYSPIAELEPSEVRRVTEVTYLGQVHGTMAALRRMRARDRGTIVQIGSALAYRSIPLQSAYCAAKAAVRGFTDSLRTELLHEGSHIRLTMVQLPAVDTPQFDWARSRMSHRLQPVPPIYAPEAVAEAIVRAAHEAPRELWVGGPAAQAILGTLAMPGTLDRMMARQAWAGQQTSEPARPHADNLFEPPPGDPGAHGRFGDRARTRVNAVSATTARGLVALAAVGAAAGLAGLGYYLGARRTTFPRPRLGDRERAARLVT
ncbi:SDR family oxidoreductase [Salinarimonas soli]|uniref:SDR family oxidoreductase n=1 Tax=Salinarimonas soli TaxID=1638099 RepID=A0A5B2VR06_9HYPH|nr:SDR family oxidoreductase [Salinarimonas soli]KAA2241098.1 SDR family oxidoreductase [Salinarimonas soli]